MSKRTITPQTAKDWLDRFDVDNYRQANERVINQYARDMRAGNWHYTGDAIRFDVNGHLQDGKQRLMACVEADTEFVTEVIRNLPVESRDYMDLGKKRTLGNILKNRGYTHTNVLGAAKRLEIDVITLRQGRAPQGGNATFAEVMDMIASDNTIQFAAEYASNIPSKFMNRTVATYTYNTLHKIDPDAAAQFFSLLLEPANVPANSPILALNKRFSHGVFTSSGRLRRLQEVTLVFRAWNAWRRGEDRSQIKAVSNDEGKLQIPVPE